MQALYCREIPRLLLSKTQDLPSFLNQRLPGAVCALTVSSYCTAKPPNASIQVVANHNS